jgi:hypothetical protein
MHFKGLLPIAAFLSLVVPCPGQASGLSEAAAKERVCEYVRTRLSFPKEHFLRATRREDFEDDLFASQVKIRGQIHKAALFFEITETGYEVRSSDEALFHSSVDGVSKWSLAIDPLSGDIYGSSGFSDPVSDFNKLVTDVGIQFTSEDSAKAWVSFYLAVGAGTNYGAYLSGPVDLRRQVEDIAEAYATSRKQPVVPTRWLHALGKSGVKPLFGVQVRPDGDRFHVQVDSLAITAERTPVLQRLRFDVSSRGTISDQVVVPLFPRIVWQGSITRQCSSPPLSSVRRIGNLPSSIQKTKRDDAMRASAIGADGHSPGSLASANVVFAQRGVRRRSPCRRVAVSPPPVP